MFSRLHYRAMARKEGRKRRRRGGGRARARAARSPLCCARLRHCRTDAHLARHLWRSRRMQHFCSRAPSAWAEHCRLPPLYLHLCRHTSLDPGSPCPPGSHSLGFACFRLTYLPPAARATRMALPRPPASVHPLTVPSSGFDVPHTGPSTHTCDITATCAHTTLPSGVTRVHAREHPATANAWQHEGRSLPLASCRSLYHSMITDGEWQVARDEIPFLFWLARHALTISGDSSSHRCCIASSYCACAPFARLCAHNGSRCTLPPPWFDTARMDTRKRTASTPFTAPLPPSAQGRRASSAACCCGILVQLWLVLPFGFFRHRSTPTRL